MGGGSQFVRGDRRHHVLAGAITWPRSTRHLHSVWLTIARAAAAASLTRWRPADDEIQPMLFITVGAQLLAIFPEELDTTSRTMPVAYLGAPVVFEDLLLVGSNTRPGSVRAFNVRTGSQAWAFHSTPQPGEFGHDSWESDAWRDQPNLFHWAFSLTVDEERELVFAASRGGLPRTN